MAYTAAIDTANTLLGATLDEIKDFLGVTSTAEDNVITDLINEASWSFNRECNRLFLTRSITAEYHDGDGGRILWLKNPPVTSVAIYEDYDREFGADTAIDTDDYTVSAETGRVEMLFGCFATGTNILKATYTGGYADGSIPLDLRMAARIRVSRLYRLWKSGAYGTTSRSDDKGGQTGYLHEMHPIEKMAIAKYRLREGMA